MQDRKRGRRLRQGRQERYGSHGPRFFRNATRPPDEATHDGDGPEPWGARWRRKQAAPARSWPRKREGDGCASWVPGLSKRAIPEYLTRSGEESSDQGTGGRRQTREAEHVRSLGIFILDWAGREYNSWKSKKDRHSALKPSGGFPWPTQLPNPMRLRSR